MADKYIVVQNDYMDGDGIDEDTTTTATLGAMLKHLSEVVEKKEKDGFSKGTEGIECDELDEDNFMFGFSLVNEKTGEESTFEVGTV